MAIKMEKERERGFYWTLMQPAASASEVTTVWCYRNLVINIIIIIIIIIIIMQQPGIVTPVYLHVTKCLGLCIQPDGSESGWVSAERS